MMGSSEKELPENWKTLQEIDQIETIKNQSHDRAVAIFKHSTRCGISHMAKHQLERDWDFGAGELDFYYLDLIRHRPVSNAVSEKLGVVHQSPQIIVLKDGKVVYHTSHHMISAGALRKAI